MSLEPKSLRTRFLLAVILCAVLPLAAVGVWLSMSISRAGERFIESQLDSVASRAVHTATARWALRQADVALLAENEPTRRALGGDSAAAVEATAYLARAFASMPQVAWVVVRDAANQTRWSFGLPPDEPRESSPAQPRRDVTLGRRILGDGGQPLGRVEARVRLDGLLASPSAPTDAGAGFVALHSRGAWLLPPGVQSNWLAAPRFDWSGHHWAVVSRSLADPPLDIFAASPTDGFVHALTRTADLGVLALTTVGVAVLLLTVVVTRRMTRSLTRLADAADAVSQGNLDTRIDLPRTDEVGRVAHTFNEMTASLRAMMYERSQREAVSAMGELAATLAHQVRSPATAMRLDIERAAMRLPPNGAEQEMLGRALAQLDRLERTVSAALRVARSEATSLHELDVRAPLERAMAGVSVEAAERGVTVSGHGNWEALNVNGDGPALEQLFTNVLMNAVQAARKGGSVAVHVSSVESIVSVRDDGALVAPEVLSRAGEPFFSTKPEGTGLGLAIARRIAAAHGAVLVLQSRPDGTTAELRFLR